MGNVVQCLVQSAFSAHGAITADVLNQHGQVCSLSFEVMFKLLPICALIGSNRKAE